MDPGKFEEMLNRSYVDASLMKGRESDRSMTFLEPEVKLENTRFTLVEMMTRPECISLSLENCILSQVTLLGHDNLSAIKIINSDLLRLRIPITESMHVSISRTRMNHVTLKGAKIRGGRFEDFSLCNSDLSFSEFMDFSFSYGIFAVDTVYIGSKFTSCSFEGVYLPEQMLDAEFEDCFFKGCTMTSQMKLLLMRNNRFETAEKSIPGPVISASVKSEEPGTNALSKAAKSRFSSIR